MEEIRAFACDELLQLSHGGDDVGGILFGTRHEDLVRILTWRPMACEHIHGQGLRLSYNDRMNLAVQLEIARQNPDLKDLRPVGWFVSHLNGAASLSDSDLEIYSGFFPEAWQVALLLCPKGNGRAQAGFFVREPNDKVRSEASYQSFELAPLRPGATAPIPPAPAAKPKHSFPASPVQPPAIQTPSIQTPPIQAPLIQTPAIHPPATPGSASQAPAAYPPKIRPPAAPQAPVFKPLVFQASASEAPSFRIEEEVPARERWYWAIPIALALGIAAFMLYQRQVPSPSASIALRAWNEAQTVQLAWDANSRALRDSYRGQIEIHDGTKNSQIALSSEQLHAGKMSYIPQSSDVGIVMTVYPAKGDPFHDSTRVIVPSFETPTQPPQLLPAAPSPPAADQTALQQQVQHLKEDLSKERARADELQNLVRILENRLSIQSEAPKPPPKP
jgi:proteasome lid subunit RPN8/RPN11